MQYTYKVVLDDERVKLLIASDDAEQREALTLIMSPKEYRFEPPLMAVMVQEIFRNCVQGMPQFKDLNIEVEDIRNEP